MFTGDRSGDWLYRAMNRAGFASQPESRDIHDGLELFDTWVTSAVRCAPPQNKPLPAERDNCEFWLDRELDLLAKARVYICLGNYGYLAMMRRLGRRGYEVPRPRPRFGHGAEFRVPGGPLVLMSYHPSQQNTFTGRLTEAMFDDVFSRAISELLEGPSGG
jgi:uracil-DNA glycosylase family 4